MNFSINQRLESRSYRGLIFKQIQNDSRGFLTSSHHDSRGFLTSDKGEWKEGTPDLIGEGPTTKPTHRFWFTKAYLSRSLWWYPHRGLQRIHPYHFHHQAYRCRYLQKSCRYHRRRRLRHHLQCPL